MRTSPTNPVLPMPATISTIVQPGDLVFDVGAHRGDKTADFLAQGARVVCVEPQPHRARELRERFADDDRVTVVAMGLAEAPGRLPMQICSQADVLSTFSREWTQGRFAEYEWDQTVEVEVTTLDALIDAYGVPDLLKIDVEGFEYDVLRGLSRPVPVLSFEFAVEFFAATQKCLAYLRGLGYRQFNLGVGEHTALASDDWLTEQELIQAVASSEDPLLWGDVYAHAGAPRTAAAPRDAAPAARDHRAAMAEQGVWTPGTPLRLHLGCGETRLDGYVNVDYPPENHNIMTVAADYFADVTQLDFPDGTVDEVRLHHVFEHFGRVTAMGLLVRWHRWLKVGGRLYLETPDILGSARMLTSNAPWHLKMGAIRHLSGDQADTWAYHLDHWFPERYQHTLPKLGFGEVETKSVSWPHEPYLANVHAVAVKTEALDEDALLEAAEALLWENTVAEVERPVHDVWCRQLRAFVARAEQPPAPSNRTQSLMTAPAAPAPAEAPPAGGDGATAPAALPVAEWLDGLAAGRRDTSALKQLAVTAMRQGDDARARRCLLAACAQDPDDATAVALLERLGR